MVGVDALRRRRCRRLFGLWDARKCVFRHRQGGRCHWVWFYGYCVRYSRHWLLPHRRDSLCEMGLGKLKTDGRIPPMKGRGIETLLVAAAVGGAACLGDQRWHVEQRLYTPEPTLTFTISLSTRSGTAPSLGTWVDQGRSQFT